MNQQAIHSNFNPGISLCKMLMCFEVILIHFWNGWENTTPIYLLPFKILAIFAVPFFMVSSFYLTQKYFADSNSEKAKKRLQKLIGIQVFWAIIYWFVYFLTSLFSTIERPKISDLFWQILTGHSPALNPTMWFQTVLIAITSIYLILFLFVKKKQFIIIIVSILSVLCFILQYSGINYKLFSGLRYELQYPLGRFFETFPMATLGLLLAFSRFLRSKKRQFIIIPAFVTILGLLFANEKGLFPKTKGFGYSGIQLILLGVSVFVLFYCLPSDHLPHLVKAIIFQISKYTLGIYCIHRLAHRYLLLILSHFGISVDLFALCIATYVVSYFICYLISKIPIKSINNYV